MCQFTKQAIHNEDFHSKTCEISPDDFFDWKITTLFYVAIHYVKGLANQLNINIGTSHGDIRANIQCAEDNHNKPKMAFTRGAYKLYDILYTSSKKSRYMGFIDGANSFTDHDTFQAIMKKDHEICEQAIGKLKNYIIETRGLKIEDVEAA